MHLFANPSTRYRDREHAGEVLARLLAEYAGCADTVVLALPRGGVPVARVICDELALPLDVFLVRKLGVPAQPELALGAIASGGVRLLDDVLVRQERLSPATIDELTHAEAAELARREAAYRSDRPPVEVRGRRVVLVDDGVATGYTMRVAVVAMRQRNPAELVVAVPVGAPETCVALGAVADKLVCPMQPSPFHAVGLWYDHFPQLSDHEVRELLAHSVATGD